MASEAPDPRSFKTWDDAFQYPVPVVRKLEQQLRNNANENREKLRSLVGASYRDLLGTAERIIEMDHQMQDVETTLGLIGQKCNSRRVDKVGKNYSGLLEYARKRDGERYHFAAQLAVLQSCPTVIRRMLKKGSTLLAAKLLVVSRLLHKTLAQAPDAPPLVDALKNQLASLRRKLLHSIDKQFSRSISDTNDVLESMCAFSLATSSTPSDVLRHFHHVRLESITRLAGEGRTSQEQLPRALKLYIRTLVDTQSIFPKRLADALVKLKTRPLLQDQDIQAISELNLDIHERWIADEVRNFTPWPRHDELSKADAERLLKTWAKQAIKALLNSIRSVLSYLEDPKAVISARKEMLETWLSSSSRGLGVDSGTVLDDLRDVLNDRLRTLLGDRARRLSQVTSELSSTIDASKEGSGDGTTPLWDASTTSIDTSNGAPAFKLAIIERRHGINGSLRRLITIYDEWARSLEEAYAVVKEMKETRWDDDLSGDDVGDDDFDLESKQVLLSEDDARSLEDSLQEALSAALAKLQKDVDALVSTILSGSEEDSSPKAALVLRALREVSQRLATFSTSTRRSLPSSMVFPASLTQPLHLAVAKAVAATPLSAYKRSIQKFSSSPRARARTLWEGSPPLPVQPSVGAFKFLSKISQEMTARGGDIWSPGAVSVLKKELGTEVATILSDCVKPLQENSDAPEKDESTDGVEGEEATNGEPSEKSSKKAKADVKKEIITHLLFDVLYLQRALAQQNSPQDSALASLEKRLQEAAGADVPAVDRLRKNAADYWRRTYLLFALLS